MKTFKEFLEECYDLEESSGGERSGRRTRGKVTLARGRGADMTRQERSTAAVAKKAGMRGTGKYSTKDLRTKPKHYTNYETDYYGDIGSTEQDHTIITHSSPRKAAQDERIILKRKDAGRDSSGRRKYKTAPSNDSARRLKDFKKQISKSGADKLGRVHSVEINQRDSMSAKGDKKKLISRGKNFIKAVKDTPEHLKKAGAKKGEVVVGKPEAVMSGEDEKTGQAKRAKLYKKIFGKRSTKKSEKTGMMVGKAD